MVPPIFGQAPINFRLCLHQVDQLSGLSSPFSPDQLGFLGMGLVPSMLTGYMTVAPILTDFFIFLNMAGREFTLMDHIQIKELVEFIARSLADHPEQIVVHEISGPHMTLLELRTAKDDLGKIIGKEGRNVDAIRTITNAVASKFRKRAVLDIIG
jgi:predicted RNA-binding protein YlqC (UPF0109 family)